MRIEYELIKKSNDFCRDTTQFKNLLMTNSRLKFDNDSCILSDKKFNYSLASNEVKWNKHREVVFHFVLSTDTNNEKDAISIENFDEFLRRVNDECGKQFVINTIWDDASLYYAKKLYPLIAEVENLLRKIIYLFMINIAGSAWFDSTVPGDVKKSISNAQDKDKAASVSANADQLYHADFVQLGRFFFLTYPLKPIDSNAVKRLKEMISKNKDIKEIDDALNLYENKSNWDRYFAEKIPVENLAAKWDSLYYYRNLVAHTKRLRKPDYDEAVKIIKELSSAFKSCLDHVDEIHFTEEESAAAKVIAEKTVSSSYNQAYSKFINAVINSMPTESCMEQTQQMLGILSKKLSEISNETIDAGYKAVLAQDLSKRIDEILDPEE